MRLDLSKCDENHYRQVIDSYLTNFHVGNDKIDILHFKKIANMFLNIFLVHFMAQLLSNSTQ